MTENPIRTDKPIGEYFKFMDERKRRKTNLHIKLEGHKDPLRRIIKSLPVKKGSEYIKKISVSLSKRSRYITLIQIRTKHKYTSKNRKTCIYKN